MKRVLVSGGAGFIGSHVVDHLVSEGREVWILDNLSAGTTGNLESHLRDHSIVLIKGDIRDEAIVSKLIRNVDGVVHLAAIVDHEICLQNPELAIDVNANGTSTLLEEARKHGVKRFVYASTAAVYGQAKTFPISEDSEPVPIAPYGATKLEGERHCLKYRESHGLDTVCLRYFNVFGPRQSAGQYSGVITQFMNNAKQGKPLIIHGDGLQTRDFVNVSDIVQATALALDSDSVGGVYNIATGVETAVHAVADGIIEISGYTFMAPLHDAERPGDIRRSVADIQKARRELHYAPRTDFQRDIRELWDSYVSINRRQDRRGERHEPE